jgi:DNA polymerase-3 subunit gamma/tau
MSTDEKYIAIYRRFRPETFDEVFGQEHVVRVLKHQIATGTTGHAYLFCGTRGTGKTSLARILAKGVNCLADDADARPCGTCANCEAVRTGTFVDVAEIDAASNNGVDSIRELRDSVIYPPLVGRCKVYIIDEVHMLTQSAFNALLKTLEEPPENVIFILATTEPHKVPATILSRCLRLDFRRVPAPVIAEGMRKICTEIGVKASPKALMLLAHNADGSVRDGLSLLDQCAAMGEDITREHVLEILGSPGAEVLIELTDHVFSGRISEALTLIDKVLAEGKEVRRLMDEWLEHYRNLMLVNHLKQPDNILNISEDSIKEISQQSAKMPFSVIENNIISLAKTISEAKWSSQPRTMFEVAMIRMALDSAGDGE